MNATSKRWDRHVSRRCLAAPAVPGGNIESSRDRDESLGDEGGGVVRGKGGEVGGHAPLFMFAVVALACKREVGLSTRTVTAI